jgi:hypothetical protein
MYTYFASENLRRRSTWEDNPRMSLEETEFEVVDWIHLAEDGIH